MSSQVLTKASKIIPVMIMGKVVSARKYETYEYVVALLISVGMTLFLFGSQADRADSSGVTTFTGVILLVGKILPLSNLSFGIIFFVPLITYRVRQVVAELHVGLTFILAFHSQPHSACFGRMGYVAGQEEGT